jgi:two-component SAPR family response regulator
MENRVHEGHERQWNITQLEWHHLELVRTIPSPHGHLFHIFINDVDLIIPQLEINSAKVFCPIELIQQIVNAKEKIVVIYR